MSVGNSLSFNQLPVVERSPSINDLLQGGRLRLSAVGDSITNFPSSFVKSAIGNMLGKASAEFSPAVGGALSSALAAQVSSVRASANAVAMMAGTNDAAGGVTVAQHITNLKNAAAAILARGMTPLVIASPPRETTIALITSYVLAERVWCESANIAFVDPWSRYVDTDGSFVAGSAADGDHPDPPTMWQVGVDMAALLVAGNSGYLLPRANLASVSGGLLDNNLLLLDNDSNGRPDGWSGLGVTGNNFALAPAAYPARGNACTVTIAQSTLAEVFTSLNAFGLGGWSVGETLRVVGMLSLENMSNCKVNVFARADTDVYLGLFQANTSGFVFLSANVVMQPATTNLQLWFTTSAITAGAYTCNLKFAAWNVYNISRNTY